MGSDRQSFPLNLPEPLIQLSLFFGEEGLFRYPYPCKTVVASGTTRTFSETPKPKSVLETSLLFMGCFPVDFQDAKRRIQAFGETAH